MNGQHLQRSNTASKTASRATTPGLPAQNTTRPQPAKTTAAVPSKRVTKAAPEQTVDLDVFDVPSDDEEASLPIPEAPRLTSRHVSKESGKQLGTSRVALTKVPQKIVGKQKELGSLQNRKRKGSVSLAAVSRPTSERSQEPLIAKRDRKVPKRDQGTSPGHDTTTAPMPRPAPQITTLEVATNKPRRTRTRTVPVIDQPTMLKGQSSPAVLHKMTPAEQISKQTHEESIPEVPASDDTMYDIPDTISTPVRATPLRRTTTSTPGSVTPRQKDLFSTLLGGSAAPKTPASALASLQLTEQKPRSLLSALARSKSDVAYSSQAKKTRLLTTLKNGDTSSEEEDSGSDEEVDNIVVAEHDVDMDKTPVQTKRPVLERNISGLRKEETTAADSQTSQTSSGAVTRPKLTYATQRSYLQDANSEEEFLMSMDLDDNWKLDSQAASTDDEEGSTSQPRTHHELRKYGQNTMFSWDMEESIREISDESNKGGRRSAMMDLCTKMADAGFVSQLLDSGFMHQLLDSITSSGDTVFDFVSTASLLFILQTKPAYAVVDQISQSGVTASLTRLAANEAHISRIARDRKSNMSKIAQESLAEFCTMVLAAKVWSFRIPEKASPQILALKTVDLLTRSLRESGSTEALLTANDVLKIVSVCTSPSGRIKAGKSSPQDLLVLDLVISVLETVSIADQDSSIWSTKVLQTLSDVVPVFFEDRGLANTVEALKLCTILTNNKPKACQPFATQTFVRPLVNLVVTRFDLLETGGLDAERRTQVLATLTLGLGTMINLAELSDQARLNAMDDSGSIDALVKTFIAGSQRADEADSLEETRFGVTVGFLTVLLGNMCLNSVVRSKVQAILPDQRLSLLLEKMRDFARIHAHVDKNTASRFEGPEGQQALSNYYIRIMHVVKKLESAKE